MRFDPSVVSASVCAIPPVLDRILSIICVSSRARQVTVEFGKVVEDSEGSSSESQQGSASAGRRRSDNILSRAQPQQVTLRSPRTARPCGYAQKYGFRSEVRYAQSSAGYAQKYGFTP